jgi:uncharacterized membrane protein (TIGR02234 family)
VSPGLGPTALVGLAGAGLAAVSSAQVWGRAEVTAPAVRVVEVSGADVAPVALPLALVALAAWGAVLVLRRRGRRVVAVVGLAAAIAAVVAVALRLGDVAATALASVTAGAARSDVTTESTLWPYAAGLGALLTALAFVAAYRAAPTWPEMSGRYDSPASSTGRVPAEESTGDLWRALDEGRDPTA